MGKFFKVGIFKEATWVGFSTSAAYGTVPVYSVQALSAEIPGPVKAGFSRVTDVHFRLNPTNAVTYRIYMYSDNNGIADSMELELSKFYDSTEHIANCVGDTEYLREVDRTIYRSNVFGRVYFVITWSASPGNTTGYISVEGERDG